MHVKFLYISFESCDKLYEFIYRNNIGPNNLMGTFICATVRIFHMTVYKVMSEMLTLFIDMVLK